MTRDTQPLFNRGAFLTIKSARGSQLLEFAFMLPLLLAIAVGVADFGAAFVLRDKLTNAAREGVRIAVGQPTADLTLANPTTVQSVRDIVLNYLSNASVAATLSGTAPCASTAFSWTYCLSNGGSITIERQFIVPIGGTLVLSSRVTIAYPYSWTFSRVFRLLVRTSNFANPVTIQVASVMKNFK